MGRYYSGDIEGKFWFAVQDSNDADNFGVDGVEPQELTYYFEEEHLSLINSGIKKCRNGLGKYKKLIDIFFKESDCYDRKQLSKYLKINIDKVQNLLILYARLDIGLKIRKCVKKEGKCYFTAEC